MGRIQANLVGPRRYKLPTNSRFLFLFGGAYTGLQNLHPRFKSWRRLQNYLANCHISREIEGSVEPNREIHVILDNLSAHRAPAVHRWQLRHPHVHFHFTPTYASWLNLVERFFGLLTEKALKRGSHTSIPQLREAILAYVATHNEHGKPFRWTKTADEILDKLRRFGVRTQQVHGR